MPEIVDLRAFTIHTHFTQNNARGAPQPSIVCSTTEDHIVQIVSDQLDVCFSADTGADCIDLAHDNAQKHKGGLFDSVMNSFQTCVANMSAAKLVYSFTAQLDVSCMSLQSCLHICHKECLLHFASVTAPSGNCKVSAQMQCLLHFFAACRPHTSHIERSASSCRKIFGFRTVQPYSAQCPR